MFPQILCLEQTLPCRVAEGYISERALHVYFELILLYRVVERYLKDTRPKNKKVRRSDLNA